MTAIIYLWFLGGALFAPLAIRAALRNWRKVQVLNGVTQIQIPLKIEILGYLAVFVVSLMFGGLAVPVTLPIVNYFIILPELRRLRR